MREIKFRCWNHLDSKIVKTENLNHPYLMQFTSLYDKTSKEIYEGDIVSFPYITPLGDIDEYCYTAKIIFENGCFGLEPILYDGTDLWHQFNPLINWLEKEKGEYISNFGNKVIYGKCILEVIGNIYENAELLEGDTK